MSRFLRYWLLLAPTALVASYLTSAVAFRHLDFSFVQFAVLLVAPLAQAAALALEAESPWRSLAESGGVLRRHAMAQPIATLDLLIVLGGIAAWPRHVVGFGAAYSVQPAWIATKLAAAAVLMCASLGVRRDRTSRMASGACAVVALACALDAALGWSGAVYEGIQGGVRVRAVVLRPIFYGALFTLGVATVWTAARALSRDAAHCARFCALAVACAIPAAVAVALSIFNVPAVVQPWRGIALLFASCAGSAMLHAGVLAAWPGQPARAEVQAP